MPKNIVLCIDGTGNEYGDRNSNVVKLYSALEHDNVEQLTFYHPGLGTMGSRSALTRFQRWWTKLFGLAFGLGISDAIADCYSFLMEHYEAGDKIFLFGFSRGAYCARALAGMLHMYGLLRTGNEPLVPYVLRMFTKKGKTSADFGLAGRFRKTFSRTVEIHFVGVWDTVSSVGWAYDPLSVPFSANNPDVRIARHAVSVDEKRAAFRQNQFTAGVKNQDLIERWFSGVHSDVGGGYPEGQSGLAKIALKWMIEQSTAAGLLFNAKETAHMLGMAGDNMSAPDVRGKLHTSLKGWWWVLEILPRQHYDMTVDPPKKRWKIPLGRPRRISADAKAHPSVDERMAALPEYRPKNIPAAWSQRTTAEPEQTTAI